MAASESSVESAGEVELYGELGILPKVGIKVRLARKARVDRVLSSAAGHAELAPAEFEDQLAGGADQLRDVVVMAAVRAEQVDDDDYLDVLGRLIAGALDSARIDEISFITSEITKLEPVHLRALFGLFHFGKEGVENADPELSPANAAWAVGRYRPEREIAYLLDMGRETTSQVLLRLERDGLVQWGEHSGNDERTRGPSDWAGRVLSLLFPPLKVTFGDDGGEESDEVSAPTATPPSTTASAVLASITAEDSFARQQRTISELEKEIKKSEKERLSPLAHDITGVEERWLLTLKQRLRRVDPDNPWAYDD